MSNKYLVECYEYPNNDVTEGKPVFKSVSIEKRGKEKFMIVKDMNKTLSIPLTVYLRDEIKKGMK